MNSPITACEFAVYETCSKIITVTSHERHGIPHHRHLDCLLHSLFELTNKVNMKDLHYWGFASEIIRMTDGFLSQGASN